MWGASQPSRTPQGLRTRCERVGRCSARRSMTLPCLGDRAVDAERAGGGREMRTIRRALILGVSHLCVFVGGVAGALLVGEPDIDPLAGVALSWGAVDLRQDGARESLEERLRAHDTYVSQLLSSESEDVLLLARLVASSTLAALSDGPDRDVYLSQSEQACLRLEWEDCTEGVFIELGEKQLRSKEP